MKWIGCSIAIPAAARCIVLTWIVATLTLLPVTSALADADSAKSYEVLVFSRPVEGRQRQFNEWYDHQHIHDMLQVPGFLTAERFHVVKADTPTSSLPPYLAVYRIRTGDLAATNAEVKARAASGQIARGPAFDYASSVTVIVEPLGREVLAESVAGATAAPKVQGKTTLKTFYLLVFSDPAENREEEYNHWYDSQHIPDVLRVPGFVSGRRFRVVDNETPGTTIPSYMVRFKFRSYDLDTTTGEILRRLQSGITRTSSAFGPNPMVYYLAPRGSLVSRTAPES
jgi:hypothetical protein